MSAVTMRAAVFGGDGRIGVERIARPEPAADEVLVRLEGCGICASNLPVWEGQPWFQYPLEPGSPGHEGWGSIEAVGDEAGDWKVGERVAMLSGKAYAEYDVASGEALTRVPAGLADRPMPGEPIACAMNIFRRSDIRPGQRVAVVGVGFIGGLLIQLARDAGAEVIALSRRDYALDAAQRCGANALFKTEDRYAAIGAVQELTGGAGCERVIEAAGEQSTLDIASAISAEGGRLIIAGYHQNGPRQVDMQQWNWRGLDVINAHERDPAVAARGLREAVQAVAEGRIDPYRLLTHEFSLGEMEAAFSMLQQRPDGFMKATVAL